MAAAVTTTVRTTFRPDLVLTVEATEFDQLRTQGLLYGSAQNLYVNFLSYTDGPNQEVTNVTVRIQGPSPATTDIVATTSTGVQKLGTGSYRYPWGAAVSPGAYLVTWTATDVDSTTVTATETVTVS